MTDTAPSAIPTPVIANYNREIAQRFERMAAALQLLGENVFKVNAHNRVARTLRDLTDDINTLAHEEMDTAETRIASIEGIGAKSAKKIVEFIQSHCIQEYDTLMEQVPPGLFDILEIPGLGPKTVKLMWDNLHIDTMHDLKKAIETNVIADLPRMGKKTIENIKKAIAFSEQSGDRTEIGLVHPIAVTLVQRIRALNSVLRADYAGSLRRGKETIGDIDILVSSTDPAAVRSVFTSMPEVTQVLAQGETKSSVRLLMNDIAIQCDLRTVPDEVYGAALMYFTGSKEHNVRLRELAIKKRMRLNEYGLFAGLDERPQDSDTPPVAASDENAIYKALDLPMIPPPLREDRGELDSIPADLVRLDQITSDLHTHTTASDGKMSLEESIEAVLAKGYHTLAITDHSVSSVIANGLSPERMRQHIDIIREANERYPDITILAGAEVDILKDGSLDYDDELLAELDVVVASPHVALRQDPDSSTRRLLKAIQHPLVHIIGHPTGRIVNRREGLRPNMNALFEAAAEHDVALEINSNWKRLDLRDTHVRSALDKGCLIAIDTDAHAPAHYDFLQYGIMTAQRGGLTADRCINTWSADRLHEWLRSKR